jgi:hypothetical protein
MFAFRTFVTVALTGLASGNASAQQWNDAIQFNNNSVVPLVGGAVPNATAAAVSIQMAECPSGTPFPTFSFSNFGGKGIPFTPGVTCAATGTMNINIDEFARASTVTSQFQQTQAGLTALRQQTQNALSSLQQQSQTGLAAVQADASRAAALSTSLTAMMPAEGHKNRVGTEFATVGGETAFGLSYTHLSGPVDLNLGVAVGVHGPGGEALARGGFGYSW